MIIFIYISYLEEIYPWYRKINNIIKAIIFVFKNGTCRNVVFFMSNASSRL